MPTPRSRRKLPTAYSKLAFRELTLLEPSLKLVIWPATPTSKRKVSESMAEKAAGLSVLTMLPRRSARPTPFMPRVNPCDWSLSTPRPYWL